MTESVPAKPSRAHFVSWVLLLVALAAAGAVALRNRAQPLKATADADVGAEPLALVPAGPRLVISADLQRLIEVAGPELSQAFGQKLLGLREVCGFEPLLALQNAVFVLPFDEGKAPNRESDFALIAATSLQPAAGLRCAELVIKKRGGAPATTRFGAFSSMRDLAKPLGEVALRTDGMFVLSGGQYFRDVMDVASGTARVNPAALLRSQLHRSLRAKLGRAQLSITLLPNGAGIFPDVAAAGLALEVGNDVSLRGLLLCKTATACEAAREVLAGAGAELAAEPGLSGLSTLKFVQQQERLELDATLPRSQLAPLLAQLASR